MAHVAWSRQAAVTVVVNLSASWTAAGGRPQPAAGLADRVRMSGAGAAVAAIDVRELDLAAYCRRIGFAGTLAPTRECLDRLIVDHASAIPFENIEVLAHRVPKLDLAGLQDKLVRRRRGGYCFEQNTLFRAVLQAIGFDVRPMEARIRSGVPADVVTARTHLATRVVLDGVAHLVDVGCSTVAPLAPLALASRDRASGRQRLLPLRRGRRRAAAADPGGGCLDRLLPADAQHAARDRLRDGQLVRRHVSEVDAGAQPAPRPRDSRRPAAAVQPAPVGLPAAVRRAASNASCRRARNSPTCSPTASAWTSRRPISTR